MKKGQTLSGILYLYKFVPIYGRDGFLEKALALNPELLSSRGDFLQVNFVINLDFHEVYKTPEEKESHEVSLPQDQQKNTNDEKSEVDYIFPKTFFIGYRAFRAEDSNGQKAQLGSKYNFGLMIEPTIKFTNSFFKTKILVGHINYLQTDENKALSETQFTYLNFGARLGQGHLSYGFDVNSEPIPLKATSTGLEMVLVNWVSFGLGWSWDSRVYNLPVLYKIDLSYAWEQNYSSVNVEYLYGLSTSVYFGEENERQLGVYVSGENAKIASEQIIFNIGIITKW